MRNRRAIIAVGALMAFCAFFFSPDPASEAVRGVISRAIESQLDSSVERAAQGQTTMFDRFMADLAVRAGILVFRFQAPEASQIVSHYCYGDGSELRLDPTYLKTSPVVRRAIAEIPEGEAKKVSFTQEDDFRLSLALNPFTISRRKVGDATWFRVSERIEFDQPASGKKVKTNLRFGQLRINTPDAFIGILNCKPFEAVSEWQE